nr:zinc finger, CCHC-type [Tanacetum cinerariifolium]
MVAAIKHMASSFAKLEKFEGVDFRRWQMKMHFMLSSMSVVYVLTTPMPEDGGENPTVKQNVETSKELRDTLEAKYMAEDASSKKFLVSNFTNYKMTDSRLVLEQYNELLGILERFTQHKMNMDESIQVSCIIDKLPPSWKDFKHNLKHLKEELTLIELGNHLRIEESLRVQDNDKSKGNNVVGPSVVNMVEPNNSFRYNDNKGKRKHHDIRANPNKKPKVTCWKCGKPGHLKKDCKAGNVGSRANGSSTKGSEDGSFNPLKDSCRFKTYESLNDGSILYMGNESIALVHGRGCVDLRLNIVSDNIGSAFMSTSKQNDSILWHARLGHVHFKRMQDMSKDVLIPAIDMDTEKCCRPLGCKWIFKRKLKVDGIVKKFTARLVIQGFKQKSGIDYFDTYAPVARISTIRLLIAMASIHNMIIHQMDVKTTFLNGQLEDEVYMNQPLGFIMPGNENKSHYIEKVLKKFNYSDCTPVSIPLDTCEKLMPNKGLAVSQLEYSRVIGCLMYAMTCTRSDIAFTVGKLSRLVYSCYPSMLEGYTDVSWISTTEDNSSTSGWVFLLGGGAISWASKKQTCITGSTMKSEFVALAAIGKEAEWLKNLLLEIPLWDCWKFSSIVGICSYRYLGIKVRTVHPEVYEHPDSDNGYREFMVLMKYVELADRASCICVQPFIDAGGVKLMTTGGALEVRFRRHISKGRCNIPVKNTQQDDQPQMMEKQRCLANCSAYEYASTFRQCCTLPLTK